VTQWRSASSKKAQLWQLQGAYAEVCEDPHLRSMSSFLVTTLLLQSAQLQWANHPLRMSGPDNTTHVRLDGGSATPITFVHNLLDFTGEGALYIEAHSAAFATRA
jgi:hypothetical protein